MGSVAHQGDRLGPCRGSPQPERRPPRGCGTDALSDIFYPYAGTPVDAAAVKDEAWDLLVAQLGNDANITSICAILVEEGYEITADGGILLDGFLCELDDTTSSVKCTEFVYEGYTFYLLGFCDYSNGFY